MAFKKYQYGYWKKEIRNLLQKRLIIKDKIRYHKYKAQQMEKEDLPNIEKELDNLLKKAGNKN
jgi:hypothetical protein